MNNIRKQYGESKSMLTLFCGANTKKALSPEGNRAEEK
jgi:hypothetical protein